MLRGVLFDLDGTLLEIDLDAFFHDYFGLLGPMVAEVLKAHVADGRDGLDAVLKSTEAMTLPHPASTNREAFNTRFYELTGADLNQDEYARAFDEFYAEVFPRLQGSIGPRPGARRAVEAALALDLRVAVATNPIFPRAAIEERMRWAGIDDLGVTLVTTYENMHATKPLPAYFSETATLLGVEPARCLMVGDDRVLDMSAADVGMRTFYVGTAPSPVADWTGTLDDLADLLPRLAREPA